jgi:phage gp16-like protein
MPSPAVTPDQIRAIHTLKSRAGLDDATYRDMLAGLTGKRSSKALNVTEAVRVMDHLKGKSSSFPVAPGGRSSPLAKGSRRPLDGPYAAKLQALWISAWNLGLARDRRDAALLAFVARQTGIEHTRWLRDPAEATRAIEGLKAWLARDGGVRWAEHPREPARAVVEAQLRRLGLTGPAPAGSLSGTMKALGAEIRAAAKTRAANGAEA